MGRGPEADGWWELKHRLEWREHLLECVCVWVPCGGVVCICAFWFSQSVCVFPWFSRCPLTGYWVSTWLLAHVLRFFLCVCLCVCVYTTTDSRQFGVHPLYHTPPPQQPAGPNTV